MRARVGLVTLVLAALTATAPAAGATRLRPHVVAPETIRVHDGDTFSTGDETIRLRGVDTPELGEAKSWEARRRLAELLRAGPVTIVPRAEDIYGRTVADVYVGGRDVAALLRAEGYAKPGSDVPWWRRPRPRRLTRR